MDDDELVVAQNEYQEHRWKQKAREAAHTANEVPCSSNTVGPSQTNAAQPLETSTRHRRPSHWNIPLPIQPIKPPHSSHPSDFPSGEDSQPPNHLVDTTLARKAVTHLPLPSHTSNST